MCQALVIIVRDALFRSDMVCLTGNGIVKRLLGQVAGLVGGVQNLIVED